MQEIIMKKLRVTAVLVVLATVLLPRSAQAQPVGDFPFVPSGASIDIQTNGPSVTANVTVEVPSTCEYAGTWGTPVNYSNNIVVYAQFWTRSGVYCAQVMSELSNTYNLGLLPPGNYTFILSSGGMQVASQSFTVSDRDTDGDGMLDSQETVADTNPQDPTSVLRIIAVQVESATNQPPAVRITWQGGSGAHQVLSRGSAPGDSPAMWQPIFTNIPPTLITNSYLDPAATNSSSWYRLQVDTP